ncbi:hypothetical protein DPEC_G00371170, partial [Dallia pectoralis]
GNVFVCDGFYLNVLYAIWNTYVIVYRTFLLCDAYYHRKLYRSPVSSTGGDDDEEDEEEALMLGEPVGGVRCTGLSLSLPPSRPPSPDNRSLEGDSEGLRDSAGDDEATAARRRARRGLLSSLPTCSSKDLCWTSLRVLSSIPPSMHWLYSSFRDFSSAFSCTTSVTATLYLHCRISRPGFCWQNAWPLLWINPLSSTA